MAVGINLYPGFRDDARSRDLNQARGDAEEFARWLRDTAGLAEANIQVVTFPDDQVGDDPIDAKPRCAHVYRAIKRFKDLMEELREDDIDAWESSRLYFYASGHGFAASASDVALLTADARRGDWNHVSCQMLIEHFQAVQSFRELVVFADCCRDHVPTVAPSGPSWETPSMLFSGESLNVLGFATALGSQAFESTADPDAQRGYFTEALLEGLRGRARNPDGHVDTKSLEAYVVPRLQELTRDKPNVETQKARMPGDSFVLVPRDRLPGPYLQTVTLRFAEAPPTPLAIFQTEEPGVRRDHPLAVGEAWVLGLERGVYQVRQLSGEEIPGLNRAGYFTVLGEALDVDL